MGLSLAPDPAGTTEDPALVPPKKATAPRLGDGSAAPTLGLVNSTAGSLGLAPSTPAAVTTTPPPPAIPAIPAPTVAPPAAPVDRLKLATDNFNASAESTQPAYEAAQRELIQNGAGLGQIASGGLRTREGNLALARQRDLDVLRQNMVTKATEGSIADATTAYQQALAASQQGLAQTVGVGNLDVAKGSLALEQEKTGLNAALATAGLTGILNGTETLAAKQQAVQKAMAEGSLSLEQGKLALAQLAQSQGHDIATEQLGLAKTGQEAQIGQTQQQIDLAKQQSDIDAAYKNGTLTLAQRNQQLAELQNQQQFGLEGEKLALAKTGQAASIGQSQQQIDLAKQQADVEAQYKAGTLTLAQRNQQLAELQNSQQFGLEGEKLALAKSGQEAQTEQQKAALALQEKLGLGGLSIDQQKVAIAQKQQEAEQAYQSGQITLAQRDAALKELANAEQFGLEQGKLSLATTGQNADIAAKQRALNIQQQQADIDSQYKAGTLTLAQRNQALAELQNSQQYGLEGSKLALAKDQAADQTRLAEAGLTGRLKTGMDAYGSTTYADTLAKENQALAEAALTGSYTKLDAYGSPVTTPTLAKQQLTQTADQFGASQTQQLQLAKLADATANRQIDVGTAQGKNTLLLELARIMGGPSGNVNPSFILALAQALGVVYTPNGPTIPDGSGGNGGHVGGSGGGDGGMK